VSDWLRAHPHLAPKPVTTGIMKACCAQPENRGPWQQAPQAVSLWVSQCRVCSCRHFVMNAEPGKIGARLTL